MFEIANQIEEGGIYIWMRAEVRCKQLNSETILQYLPTIYD